ncbi:MAG TPA: OmpA family protein [Chitinophagaceae bacterium]|nr:OmpA family protein [Chitinophagaceae bacterium]
MKKKFLFVLACIITTTIYSQNSYTVSGGVLGAVNFTDFMVREPDGGSHGSIDYNTKTGWALGAWVNFPVSDRFSIEPQLMYSVHRYVTSSTSTVLIRDGKIGYVALPVLLKFHFGNHFALTAGPQVDFLSSVKNNSGSFAQKSDFNKAGFSGFAGFEVMPHSRLTFFGRYVHGFSNMSKIDDGTVPKYKNQNIQLGLKLRLFGKKKAVVQATTITTPPPPPVEEKKEVVVTEPPKPDPCAIDTDGDGVMDCNDKCLNVVGIARYNGCPIPDRDNDGVNDEEDKCPDVPGTVANNGCPEIKEVSEKITRSVSTDAQAIQFTGNTAKLTTRSNASLNHIVTYLNEDPELKVKIEAHTDNAGDDNANMTLSNDRAAAVKAYLVSKGISEDRITTEGFGETTPIADNNTAAGRMKNRRVEIKVTY